MKRTLVVSNLEVIYHRVVTAVQGVSLRVDDGKVVALLGPNGAGKSTIVRAITGFTRAEMAEVRQGRITFGDRDITGLPPEARVRLGIVAVPERVKIFETLTVEDNLMANGFGRTREKVKLVYDLFPALRERRRLAAVALSGGERQMLAIGAALCCEPSLLILDEPSLGLAPAVVGALFETVKRLNRQEGITVLLTEQNVRQALDIADYGYVLESGRVVFEGTSSRLLTHGDIMEFYLGKVDEADDKSYRQVKQYRRRRRWW